jgi:hypothetical protein
VERTAYGTGFTPICYVSHTLPVSQQFVTSRYIIVVFATSFVKALSRQFVTKSIACFRLQLMLVSVREELLPLRQEQQPINQRDNGLSVKMNIRTSKYIGGGGGRIASGYSQNH